MTAQHDLFWALNYGLAAMAWSCFGRFLLSFFVPAVQPGNYIWRGFVLITGWAVRVTALVTPAHVPPILLPLVAAFWIHWCARPLLFVLFVQAGLTPRLAP